MFTLQETLILLEKGIIKLIYKYHYHRTPIINLHTHTHIKFQWPFQLQTVTIQQYQINGSPIRCFSTFWQKIKIHILKWGQTWKVISSQLAKNLVAMSLRIQIQLHILYDLNSLGILLLLFNHFWSLSSIILLYWLMSSEKTENSPVILTHQIL